MWWVPFSLTCLIWGQRDLKSGDTNVHRHANKQRHWPKNQKGETQQSQNGVGSANSYFTRGHIRGLQLPSKPHWTDQPLLHPFLWVLLSRLIHCRQHQHSLAWLCPSPNGMIRSRPNGFSLSTSLGWRWPVTSMWPRKATFTPLGSTCRDWARAT